MSDRIGRLAAEADAARHRAMRRGVSRRLFAQTLPKSGSYRSASGRPGTGRPSQIAPIHGNAAGRRAAGRAEKVVPSPVIKIAVRQTRGMRHYQAFAGGRNTAMDSRHSRFFSFNHRASVCSTPNYMSWTVASS